MKDNKDDLFSEKMDEETGGSGFKYCIGTIEDRHIEPGSTIVDGKVVFEPFGAGVRVTARDANNTTLWGFIASSHTLDRFHNLVGMYDIFKKMIEGELNKHAIRTEKNKVGIPEASASIKKLRDMLDKMDEKLVVSKITEATAERATAYKNAADDALMTLNMILEAFSKRDEGKDGQKTVQIINSGSQTSDVIFADLLPLKKEIKPFRGKPLSATALMDLATMVLLLPDPKEKLDKLGIHFNFDQTYDRINALINQGARDPKQIKDLISFDHSLSEDELSIMTSSIWGILGKSTDIPSKYYAIFVLLQWNKGSSDLILDWILRLLSELESSRETEFKTINSPVHIFNLQHHHAYPDQQQGQEAAAIS